MAALWKGSVSFGLVNIPVSVHTAVKDDAIDFRMLEKGTLSPIGYEKVSKKSGKPVSRDNLVKGYEYEKNSFIEITPDDFKRAAQSTSDSFDIEDFVPEKDIDPRFFEKPYYLAPDKGADKAYVLLRDAMQETHMVGIGRVTMRNKQYLASIKPHDKALVLDLMRFETELIDEDEYRFPDDADLKPKEMAIAKQLISNLSGSFDPSKYHDAYRENLQKIIDAKLKGVSAKIDKSPKEHSSDIIDLMERLQQSIKKSGTSKTAPAKATAARERAVKKKPSALKKSKAKSA